MARAAVLSLYLLIFAYQVYAGVVISLYREPPVFFSQFRLGRDGLPYLLEHVQFPPLVHVAAGLVMTAFLWAVLQMLRKLNEDRRSPIASSFAQERHSGNTGTYYYA